MSVFSSSKSYRQLFFKKRFVLSACEDTSEFVAPAELVINPRLPESSLARLEPYLSHSQILRRLEHPDISLYALFSQGDELAALYWSLHPEKAIWHDKFLVEPGAALLFGAYVVPEHRRKGLYSLLIKAAHQHMLEKKVESVFTIVEASNSASLAANQQSGLKIVAHNYLIKVFGRNLFTIYRDLASGKISTDYVFRTAKSYNF